MNCRQVSFNGLFVPMLFAVARLDVVLILFVVTAVMGFDGRYPVVNAGDVRWTVVDFGRPTRYFWLFELAF